MTIERIFLAEQIGGNQIEVQQAKVVVGAGIEGDRYFAANDQPGQNITLIEAEEIEAFNMKFGMRHDYSCTRRNIITRGIRLNLLVNKDFAIGDVRLRGVELCEPCLELGKNLTSQEVSIKDVVRHFAHRSGLRAVILSSGFIAVGLHITEAT